MVDRVVVFDCESDGLPVRADGERTADFWYVECTVACALLLDAPQRGGADAPFEERGALALWRDGAHEAGASPFEPLLRAFDEARLIVGYNCADFDFPLLRKYYARTHEGARRYVAHRCKMLDVFARVREATGLWPKLDALLRAHGLPCKSSSGAQAVRWWERGERALLEAYCADDVRCTARLAQLPAMRVGAHRVHARVFGARAALAAARAHDDDDDHADGATARKRARLGSPECA